MWTFGTVDGHTWKNPCTGDSHAHGAGCKSQGPSIRGDKEPTSVTVRAVLACGLWDRSQSHGQNVFPLPGQVQSCLIYFSELQIEIIKPCSHLSVLTGWPLVGWTKAMLCCLSLLHKQHLSSPFPVHKWDKSSPFPLSEGLGAALSCHGMLQLQGKVVCHGTEIMPPLHQTKLWRFPRANSS